MKSIWVTIVLILSVISYVLGRKGFGPTDQEWGYIDVREGAHMFWWLHYTTAKVEDPTKIPLVIWLQGGPGVSSTGYGNFGEVGPLDENLELREYAWTNVSNLLFVDNPVGSGFSYVDDKSLFTTNNTQIANDFLVFLQNFYKEFPKFNDTPLYIFGESYGGKMISEIALVLHEAQKAGKISLNFKGIGLGDSSISPIDSISTWGPYLLNQGIIDDQGYKSIQTQAESMADIIAKEDYTFAAVDFFLIQRQVELLTSNIDFYNILTKIKVKEGQKTLNEINVDKIDEIMNKNVSKALGLNREWIYDNLDVVNALIGDFMTPVVKIVEKLLNDTDLKVVVYNGQLDLLVDTPGVIKWVDSLKWNGSDLWKKNPRKTMVVNGTVEGFYKNAGNLTFYWVSRAGHMVPYDNPAAMDFILKSTIGN